MTGVLSGVRNRTESCRVGLRGGSRGGVGKKSVGDAGGVIGKTYGGFRGRKESRPVGERVRQGDGTWVKKEKRRTSERERWKFRVEGVVEETLRKKLVGGGGMVVDVKGSPS